MTPEQIEERMKEISYLKIHPRDQEENRLLLLRGERIYEESIGQNRRFLDMWLRTFEDALNTYDKVIIEEARKIFKEQLKSLDEDMF